MTKIDTLLHIIKKRHSKGQFRPGFKVPPHMVDPGISLHHRGCSIEGGHIVSMGDFESAFNSVSAKDDRVIKPDYFVLSKHYGRDVSFAERPFVENAEDFEAGMLFLDSSLESSRDFVSVLGSCVYQGKTHYDAMVFPIVPKEETLVRQISLAPLFNGYPDFQEIINTGVIGSPDSSQCTYLKSEDLLDYWGASLGDETHVAPCSIPGEKYWESKLDLRAICYISTEELLKTRNVFFDPEGLLYPESQSYGHEYRKTFMVYGGIPFQAILKLELEIVNARDNNI